MRILPMAFLLLVMHALPAADLTMRYDPDKAAAAIHGVDRWLWLNRKDHLTAEASLSVGLVRGYLDAITSAKERIDDPKVDDKTKIVLCELAADHAAQIARLGAQHGWVAELTEGQVPTWDDLILGFSKQGFSM